MERAIIHELRRWRYSSDRRPIILRGARQVGKTHLVSLFGEEFDNCVVLNFEKQANAIKIFEKDLEVKRIIRDLEFITKQKITPGKTLLFLDEIQEVPRAITALRYFYEELPECHVIAAGSLLDFAIEKVGIPVGRVSFMVLYPMSFIEFLVAMGNETAVDAILHHQPLSEMSETVHQGLLALIAEYMAIGGMPAVVKTWRDTDDIDKCGEIQSLIIEGYQQDFEKYAKKHQIKYISQIYNNVPLQIGKTFKFTNVPGKYRKRDLVPCYELLEKARVIRSIQHSHGQGIPLGGQANPNIFKTLFLDVALAQRMLGHHPKEWFLHPQRELINKSEMTECFIGQELMAYASPLENHKLYYWSRQRKSSSAEVDYLLDIEGEVIPIEVKNAKSSTLKSMHLFLQEHTHSPYGIRFSTHNYSMHDNIHSYPLYAVAQLMAKRHPKLLEMLSN